jgi:hypothetical protein
MSFFRPGLDISGNGTCEEMYSNHYTHATELSRAPDDEDCDARCRTCQHGVFPTGDGDSSGVPADREDAFRYDTDDEGEDEATPQVGSAIPDEDGYAAGYAHVIPDTMPGQSLLLESLRAKALPDSSAAAITETTGSASGSSENPIVLDDDGGDRGTEAGRRTFCRSTSPVSDHSNSCRVDSSPNTTPDRRVGKKRKRASNGEDEDMLRGGKVQC